VQTDSQPPRSYEFYFPERDTLVLVEASPVEVTIRASRDTFSERRKRCFIHELAAEGFIPDDYEWHSLAVTATSRGAHWRVDPSWLRADEAARACARRFMVRLLAGGCLLWLGLMATLLLTAVR
jgi:hypothetical protein